MKFNTPMVKGRFSVIVMSYNNLDYFTGCLKSILNQNYSDIEIIIADDCSKNFDFNEVFGFIEKNKKTNITNVIISRQITNIGTVKNLNSSLVISSGEFIKCLAIDDELFDDNTLSFAAECLSKTEDGIIASNVQICDKNLKYMHDTNVMQKMLNEIDHLNLYKLLCKRNFIDAVGIFETRAFFEKFGFFDERFQLLEDWPKWLEIVKKGCKIWYFDSYTAKYRSDCGVGTGSSKKYLEDKKKAFNLYVKPYRKELGFFNYLKIRLSFYARTSFFIRKIYGFFVRGKR